MQFSQLFVLVVLSLVLLMTLVYCTEETDKIGKVGGGCLPASCKSFGCCSGNCDYWCRACGISFSC